MQYSKIIYPIAVLLAVFVVSGCSNDADELEISADGKMHVKFGVETNNTVVVTSRASAGYTDFTGSGYSGTTMGVFTLDNKGVKESASATYTWANGTGKWTSDLWLGPETYEFFSYVPYEGNEAEGVDLDITSVSSPKLKISGQPPLAKKDLLVSVAAAKNGSTLTPKSFSAAVVKGENTQVNFSMNHLLAKVVLQFKLPTEGQYYDDLRKIEITSVTLGSAVERSKSYNITFDFKAGTTVATPAAANVADKAVMELKYNGAGESLIAGKALTLSQTAPGPTVYDYEEGCGGIFYVLPEVVNNNGKKISLTVTYNVLTKDSKTGDYVVTREGVTATNNSIVVCKSDNKAADIAAAKQYTLTVNIVPSYLYMLADVDQSSSIVLQ